MTDEKRPPKRSRTAGSAGETWSDEERAAMADAARERKASARRGSADERAEGERALQEKIAELSGEDREMAERLHQLITANVPALVPRTYYGMPAWARDGKVICFFQPATKFKVRYATFGFQPDAALDDGAMWPTSWALTKLTNAEEARILELVRRAVG